MTLDSVLPRLSESSALMCSALNSEDRERYPFPVEHRRLERPTAAADRILNKLPAGKTFDQLRCILKGGPLGLFAPRLRKLVKPPRVAGQKSWGAILILPPTDWKAAARDLSEWQCDGVEATFHGLPYAFEDVLVFATVNFSPDCWFTVLSGPMKGKVFRWMHDDVCDLAEPWAQDVRGWAYRLWKEVPEVFGGVIRFQAADCADRLPKGTELFPEKLVRWPSRRTSEELDRARESP